MACGNCVQKRAMILIEHHRRELDLVRAYELAEKAVERWEKAHSPSKAGNLWSWPPELKPFWNPGHVRFYNLDTIKSELEKLDLPFSIEHIRYGSWTWLGAEIHVEEFL